MRITAADLFCGAGGTSTGLALACAELGIGLDLTAINHWQVAIDTHSRNHPTAKHICAKLDTIEPRSVVPSGRLNLLIGSPECTQHSNAKGGRPREDQSRSQAWIILHWAQALYIDGMILENVREWLDWGPLGVDGKPLKCGKGQLFSAFLNSLKAAGYNVEWRILNAADYGDATTRQRVIVQAQRRKAIVWPEPTHAQGTSFDTMEWRAARDIIDWQLPLPEIASRTRPLAPNTMARIEKGIRKFGCRPFLISYYGNGDALSIDDPLDTVTTKDRFALVVPGPYICYRMLQPHELAAAMGFPESYDFAGGKADAVKQIGNAVPVNMAKALCSCILQSAQRTAEVAA